MSQEEQHSLTAAIPHCLTTLTKLTAFKLSQQNSPHFQIIIWMLNNQYQDKSPSRQGQQSCPLHPSGFWRENPHCWTSKDREHTSREHQEKHHSGKSLSTSAQKCTSSFQGATPAISPAPCDCSTAQQARAQSCFTQLKLKTAVHGCSCESVKL